jgi:hypothetical protein
LNLKYFESVNALVAFVSCGVWRQAKKLGFTLNLVAIAQQAIVDEHKMKAKE